MCQQKTQQRSSKCDIYVNKDKSIPIFFLLQKLLLCLANNNSTDCWLILIKNVFLEIQCINLAWYVTDYVIFWNASKMSANYFWTLDNLYEANCCQFNTVWWGNALHKNCCMCTNILNCDFTTWLKHSLHPIMIFICAKWFNHFFLFVPIAHSFNVVWSWDNSLQEIHG